MPSVSIFSVHGSNTCHCHCHNSQLRTTTCPEAKSLWTFYDPFWTMSIKQTSRPYACSTKSVTLAHRMCFIAIYMLRPADHSKSNKRLPSRPNLPEEFARSNCVAVTHI